MSRDRNYKCHDDEDRRFIDETVGLRELDTDLYLVEKTWKVRLARGTFGGQIVAQALMAASRTVGPGLNLHSLHSYFLRAGDVTRPVIYRVSHTRDGQSFCSRSVSAIQNGKHILTLQASYHKEEAEQPSILEYQQPMPIVKHHSKLCSTAELIEEFPVGRKSATIRDIVRDLPVQVKPTDPEIYMATKPNPEKKILSWIRVSGFLGEEQNVHKCAMAYISDWSLLGSAMPGDPHNRISMATSLDHSMWFHRPIKMNEWVLYETSGVQMANSRALCQGRMWNADGQLVATISQEGLIRARL